MILGSGLSSLELSEVRSTGALVGLGLGLALLAPGRLRVRARELPFLALFGILGLAFVQLFYFLAINRLPIGVALLIQYLAPLLIALYARTFMHEQVRPRIWLALGLALAGLTLVVQLWDGLTLDGAGLAACLAAAVTYALYVLLAEHGVRTRDPISLSAYGFLFASLFWAVVRPWWGFPGDLVTRDLSLLGNLAESTSRHASDRLDDRPRDDRPVRARRGRAPARQRDAGGDHRDALEPVAATVVAWVWLGESLGFFQLFGGFVVLSAIILAQTSR